MEDRRSRATLREVAELSGVSISTASRVFSRPQRVNVDTVLKVHQVAEQLGYTPKPADHDALDSEMKGLIAVVVSDLGNPVYAQFTKSIQRQCLQSGFGALIIDTQEASIIERNVLTLVNAQVDGVLLASSRLSNKEIQKLADIKPLVALNRSVLGIKSVISDAQYGIEESVNHLTALGHRRITYLAGPSTSWQNAARWEALSLACNRRSLPLECIECPAPTYDGGFRCLLPFAENPTTAVIAYNDIIAIGFMMALKSCDVDVPGQVSVIGIDDIPISSRTSPALSTIAIDRDTLGMLAARELIAQVRHTQTDGSLIPILQEAHLLIRQSTAPAPSAPPQL